MEYMCRGTDPNRNFGHKWNTGGSSGNPCSETYRGPQPFSEPETKSISEHILKNSQNIKLYMAVHSYSQLLLTPWGYTSEYPSDYEDLKRAADNAAAALYKVHGTEYEVGSSTNVLCK